METDGAVQDGPPRSPAPRASQAVENERRVKEEAPPSEEQERLEQAQELAVRPCRGVLYWETMPGVVMRSTRHLHPGSAARRSPDGELCQAQLEQASGITRDSHGHRSKTWRFCRRLLGTG